MINITREFIVNEKRENALPKNIEDAIELLEHCRQLDFYMAKPTQDAIDKALKLLKEQYGLFVYRGD